MITPGLCYRVTLQGRREIVRRAADSHIKPYHLRPSSLHHDKYAYFAWGPDRGLAAASTFALPIYTLVDRCPIQLPNGSWRGDTADVTSTVPSQGLSQRVNSWTASHPYSCTCFTFCGKYINRPTTGPDPLQSQKTVDTSQLTEHMLCWKYPLGLWFGGALPTNKEGSNEAEPKYMSIQLFIGEFGTQTETGKS